jgi:hypothetical protein
MLFNFFKILFLFFIIMIIYNFFKSIIIINKNIKNRHAEKDKTADMKNNRGKVIELDKDQFKVE